MARDNDGPPDNHRDVPPPDDPDGAPRTQTALVAPGQRGQVSKANETAAAVYGERERAAIEARTIMARRFPRVFDESRNRMLDACGRYKFADSAIYSKPMTGSSNVEGLSVRFAEEFVRQWANLDVAVNIISENDDFVVLEGVATDLETLNAVRQQARVPKYVERKAPRKGDEIVSSRENSRGEITYRIRAHDDALFTLLQSMSAKLRRTVSLQHCPSDLAEECFERAEETLASLGKKDPEKFIAEVVSAFSKKNIDRAQLETYLGKGVNAITVADANELRGLLQAIKQGETTWREALDAKAEERARVADRAGAKAEQKEAENQAPAGKGTAGLKDDLQKRREKNGGTEPPKAETKQPETGTKAPVAETESPPADKPPVTMTDAELEAEHARLRAEQLVEAQDYYKRMMVKRGNGEPLTMDEQTRVNRIRRDFPEVMAPEPEVTE